MGIITNGPRETQTETVSRLRLESLIDFMVTPEDVGTLKPDARIFMKAMDIAGVAPENSVMVGDSWANDIVGASELGMKAIWFNRHGEQRPQAYVAEAITSLWELSSIMGLGQLPEASGRC